MRSHYRLPMLSVVLGLLLSTAQAGEHTYRWTDANGRVHYSDVKNPNSEQVQVKPGQAVSATPKAVTEAAAARQLDCQRKRDQLAAYSKSSDINETDSLGNTRTFTAAERQALIDRTQQQVQLACEPAAATPNHAP